MPAEFETLTKVSHDVILTAQRLIGLYHHDLEDVRIVFQFRSEPAVSAGKIAYGGTQKTTAQQRALTDDADFIIWVSEPDWHNKPQPWRDATLDHCLCHCGVQDPEGDTKYFIRPHDIDEFNVIIERHGGYNLDIRATDQAIETAKINQLNFGFAQIEMALEQASRKRGAAYTVEVKSFSQAMEE